MSHSDPARAFHTHDHSACAGDVLRKAEDICAANGARLTPVRRRTLEILLEEHRAMGAYDVLERLSQDGFGSQPPVAYRALEFLVDQGLAHRIRRLNAFTACSEPGDQHAPVFFICQDCKSVAELPEDSLRNQIKDAGQALGFIVERANVEAVGTCPACVAKGET